MKRLILIGVICFILGTLAGAGMQARATGNIMVEDIYNAVYDSTLQTFDIRGQ